MKSWLAVCALVVTWGCDQTHETDAGAPMADAAASADAFFIRDIGLVDAGGAPAPCGHITCPTGQICCQRDLRCVVPGDSTCLPPTGSRPDACASNLDCPSGSTCQGLVHGQCAGLGQCAITPDGCEGFHGVCGCDGQTYSDPCAAQNAGVRVAADVACGTESHVSHIACSSDAGCRHGHCDAGQCVNDDAVIACGSDTDCPSGQTCCDRNGLCLGPEDAALCAPAPPGTLTGCDSDAQCQRFDGSYWFGPHDIFCDADACTGPGGCVVPDGACDGTLTPVCGCDGMTYQNRCEARRAFVRITHAGACP